MHLISFILLLVLYPSAIIVLTFIENKKSESTIKHLIVTIFAVTVTTNSNQDYQLWKQTNWFSSHTTDFKLEPCLKDLKACNHYAILLIIISKRKLSLLSQTVANIFTLIEPTAAAASKKKKTTFNCFIHEIHWTNLSYYGKILAYYYPWYSLG